MAKLSVVDPDAPPPKPAEPKTLDEAIELGVLKEQLIALRAIVSKALQDPKCHPRDVGPLTRRFQDLANDLELIKKREEEVGGGAVGTEPDAWDSEAI